MKMKVVNQIYNSLKFKKEIYYYKLRELKNYKNSGENNRQKRTLLTLNLRKDY